MKAVVFRSKEETLHVKEASKILLFGRTAGDINNLSFKVIFNKQLQIMGTMMGTQKEFEAMLSFYTQNRLRLIIDKEFH